MCSHISFLKAWSHCEMFLAVLHATVAEIGSSSTSATVVCNVASCDTPKNLVVCNIARKVASCVCALTLRVELGTGVSSHDISKVSIACKYMTCI